jgi:hypothetical protein
MRSIAAGWNVGEGGVGAFRRPSRLNPEPPTGGEAYTDLLCAVFLLFILCPIILSYPVYFFIVFMLYPPHFTFYRTSIVFYRPFGVFYGTSVDFYEISIDFYETPIEFYGTFLELYGTAIDFSETPVVSYQPFLPFS